MKRKNGGRQNGDEYKSGRIVNGIEIPSAIPRKNARAEIAAGDLGSEGRVNDGVVGTACVTEPLLFAWEVSGAQGSRWVKRLVADEAAKRSLGVEFVVIFLVLRLSKRTGVFASRKTT